MAKQTINPAPAPATGWTFEGVNYITGEEVGVSGDLEKRLAERGIISKPKEGDATAEAKKDPGK